MAFADWLGRHSNPVYIVLGALWMGALGIFMAFVYTHSRFPMGAGEVWNWLLGL